MYCKFCGKRIPEKSQFCRYCGGLQKESEKCQYPKKESYFLSRWKVLFALLGPALGSSLLYGLYMAFCFFLIEIVAQFFGYCITIKGQECSKNGAERIIMPLAFGLLYFIYSSFSAIKQFLILVAQSFKLKLLFGLLDEPKNIKEYLASKGLNTLFLPKYLLFTLVFILLLLSTGDFMLILFWIVVLVMVTDLRLLRWLFIKLLKLNKYELNNVNN